MSAALGGVALAVWLVLVLGRDGFWRTRERDDAFFVAPAVWPAVVAVVPARDEASVVGRATASLACQDYPGDFRVVLVDDGSSDGTAEAARAGFLSSRHPGVRRDDGGGVVVLRGQPVPPGWTGKLWAVAQGVERAGDAPAYLLLTDADIEHAPDTLRRLVARAEAEGLVLVSLMAKLNCTSLAERMLIPAFVWFFAMLFPFARVNRPRPVAAAAGGVMLVRRDALAAAGGIAAIRGEIIDDCALGALMKRRGPIALLLTDRARSLRQYPDVASIGAMIARTAYAQLGYSPLRLAGTLFGMVLVFVAPPALAVFGDGIGRIAGATAWALMALAFAPMLVFYRRPPLWAVALPGIAAVYLFYTLVSAVQVWRGAGGRWKGRAQAMARP